MPALAERQDNSSGERAKSEKHDALSAFANALVQVGDSLASSFEFYFGQSGNKRNDSSNIDIENTLDSDEACRRRKLKAEADREASRAERLKDENSLRRRLGYSAIGIVITQLFVCDAFVLLYGLYCSHNGWEIPSQVVISWMASTIVEVIGLLLVIAKSLFPIVKQDVGR